MTRRIPMFLAVLAAVAFCIPAARTARGAEKKDISKNPEHEVRRVMAQAADRALGKNAVDGVLEMVNKDDRARIEKEISKKDDANYQAAADKVRAMWKDKYGHDFKAEADPELLKDLKINITGEGKDQTATVDFPAEPGQQSFELHLMRQKDNNFWRIQLPDKLSGDQFYDSLARSLNRLVDEKDKLPGSEDKAYERAVTWLLNEMAFPKGAK
jgi:hypothetical protein